MNYYAHHIGDYRSATAHLSNEEDLTYRRLIDMYYDTMLPIPLDTQWVCRRLRVDALVLQIVLADFFIEQDDGWHNTRCEKAIEAYKENAIKNEKNGKKGGRPKTQNNPVGSQVVTENNPVVTQLKGNQEPITNNQEPVLKNKASPLNFYEADAQVVADFVKQRKNKPTQTAIDGIKAKAEGSGYTLEAALKICCERGWQGFNPDWVKGNSFAKPSAHTGFEKTNYMEGVAADGSF